MKKTIVNALEIISDLIWDFMMVLCGWAAATAHGPAWMKIVAFGAFVISGSAMRLFLRWWETHKNKNQAPVSPVA
jgi:hypothetical protein